MGKSSTSVTCADRRKQNRRDKHGCAKLIDPCQCAWLLLRSRSYCRVGDAVRKHYIQHESKAVRECEDKPERLAGETHLGQHSHASDGND